jgi:hypothetical protein
MGGFQGSLGDQPVDKGTRSNGRGDERGGEGSPRRDGAESCNCTPPKAGVVIRATVEHIGMVGDTELTVNVKWPASTFCVQPGGKQAAPAGQDAKHQRVPGNGPQANHFDTLYGESDVDPSPEVSS